MLFFFFQELAEVCRKGQLERDSMDIERVEGMGFGRYLKTMTCKSQTLLSGLKNTTHSVVWDKQMTFLGNKLFNSPLARWVRVRQVVPAKTNEQNRWVGERTWEQGWQNERATCPKAKLGFEAICCVGLNYIIMWFKFCTKA